MRVDEPAATDAVGIGPAEWLDLLLSHEQLVIWALDRDLRFIDQRFGGTARRNLPEGSLIGRPLEEVTPPDDRVATMEAHRAALAGESVRRRYRWNGRWYDCWLEPLRREGSIEGVFAMAVDVTEAVHHEHELIQNLDVLARIDEERRDLLGRLVSAQADERRRISAELHNDLGQSVTGGLMSLQALADDVPDHLRPGLQRVEQALQEILQSVRRLTGSLVEFDVKDLGLISALRRMAEQLEDRSAVSIQVSADETWRPETVDPRVATAIYRIVQEAMTNAVRHACAQTIDVELSATEGDLFIVVEDDGSGIAPPREVSDPGSGVQLMRQQAEAFGGSFDIGRRPAGGTRLRASFPVRERASR